MPRRYASHNLRMAFAPLFVFAFATIADAAVIEVTEGGAVNDAAFQFSDSSGAQLATLVGNGTALTASTDVMTGSGNSVDALAAKVARLEAEMEAMRQFVQMTHGQIVIPRGRQIIIANAGFEFGGYRCAGTDCQNGWCVTANSTSNVQCKENSGESRIGYANSPGGGDRSMHLVDGCTSNRGGVYQDVSGFVVGTDYQLKWEVLGGSWSSQADHVFATMSDVGNRANVWVQRFSVAPTHSWSTLTANFTAPAATGRLSFETATTTSCVQVDNVAIVPIN